MSSAAPPALATTAPRSAPRGLLAALVAFGVAVPLAALFRWTQFRHASVFGLWNLFDWHDMHVFFMSSAWVEGAGKLYREVPSEYPLLANLLFAVVRVVSRFIPLADGYDRFAWAWVTIAFALWLAILYRLATRYPRLSVLLWATPSALHFSLYRYDVYAVLLALFAVEAIRADRLARAALLLGLVTALKGYSLFLLPAFLYYAWKRRDVRQAALLGVVYLAPFALGNLVTLAFSGMEGLMYAYRFHAARSFNGESTYDAVAYTFGPAFRDWVASVPRLPVMIQAAGALLALLFRPRTPDQLMKSFLFATTVFVSGSVFYSPQFVLWLVPFVAEWTFPLVSWLVVAMSWVTFAYFPIAYFRKLHHPEIFQRAVALTTAIRLALFVAIVGARPRRAEPAPVAAPAGVRP